MNIKEFEEVVSKLDNKKYHIGRVLGFGKNGQFEVTKWDIFRKDMTQEEYFSNRNLAVLSSDKGNTVEDIKNLIKEEK